MLFLEKGVEYENPVIRDEYQWGFQTKNITALNDVRNDKIRIILL